MKHLSFAMYFLTIPEPHWVLETPNYKFQIPCLRRIGFGRQANNFKIPISKYQNCLFEHLNFGYWVLFVIWRFGFGVSSLLWGSWCGTLPGG